MHSMSFTICHNCISQQLQMEKKDQSGTEHSFQQISLTESAWRNFCPSPCFSAHHLAPTQKTNSVGSHKWWIPERKQLEKSWIEQISKVQACLSQCRSITQHHVENHQLYSNWILKVHQRSRQPSNCHPYLSSDIQTLQNVCHGEFRSCCRSLPSISDQLPPTEDQAVRCVCDCLEVGAREMKGGEKQARRERKVRGVWGTPQGILQAGQHVGYPTKEDDEKKWWHKYG